MFVGAGASRACGYPLTKEILPLILERLARPTFGDDTIDASADSLRALLRRLVPDPDTIAPPDVTEVLSIIDQCLDGGAELLSLDGSNALRLRDARWLLERAIARVIGKIHPREVRPGEIVDWIESMERSGAAVTVISTNYDYSLDRALFKRRLPNWERDYSKTDFGFTWRDPDDGELVPPSPRPRVRLYKLHGALNWLTCNRCGHIIVSFQYPIVINADRKGVYSRCWCDFEPLRALLVAPSLVRSYRDPNLLSVWRSAAESLRLADDWIFLGYSMPKEDIAIRALLLRALLSREKVPGVDVVNLGNDALPDYRRLLPHCRYTGSGLRDYLRGTATWDVAP